MDWNKNSQYRRQYKMTKVSIWRSADMKGNKKEAKKKSQKELQDKQYKVDYESKTKKPGVHSDSAPIGGG